MNKNVAIIGCEYIGLEVAKIWFSKGYHVTATTRTSTRLDELSKFAQKGIVFKGHDEETLHSIIASNDTLLVAMAPDALGHSENEYVHTAELFRHVAFQMDLPRQLIYISSSSVYGDHRGLWVDETSDLLAQTEQGKNLITTEKIYASLEELGWHICILRFAEIYGPGKTLVERVKNLQGHPLPGTGEQHTNMIHKTDCASAIDYAMRHHLEGVFNLADDDHMSRKEMFHQISSKFHLPEVEWNPHVAGLHSGSKRVSNHKIKAEGFSLRHPHRVLE